MQKLGKGLVIGLGHLQTDQDATIIRALVAVVEQADVPARAHQAQKLHERAGPLGEHKAQQPLVLSQRGVATHHVAYVLFGQLIVGQVQRVEAVFREVGCDLGRFTFALRGDTHKHMGIGRVTDTVVELGHIARATGQFTN